jgi:transposase InsO family protein
MLICGRKAARGKKEAAEGVVRSAEQPGQALNVDVCFVPEQHDAQEKLPAVSGSSGRLIVERLPASDEVRHWPGQVFAEAELDYEAAMLQYAQATQERLIHTQAERRPRVLEPSQWRLASERWDQRFRMRQQRQQEDASWLAAKAEHHQANLEHRALSRQERKQQRAVWEAQEHAWRKLREQRQQRLQQRQQENEAWHQCVRTFNAALADETQTRIWIAILVVTDNCTRQSLSLPIFRSGAKLTSHEVVLALQTVLPKELAFLISDQGTQFRSTAFAQFALDAGFIHVPVYRHRPESNGIAERFVLTLKNWLRCQAWQSAEQLQAHLAVFIPEYNERPHQGLAIPGLSPNEFANRIWLM